MQEMKAMLSHTRLTLSLLTTLLLTAMPGSQALAATPLTPTGKPATAKTGSKTADEDVIAARNSIRQEGLEATVRELAKPKYNGRLPGTEGDTLSRDWLVKQFESIGLTPAGSKGYLQPFTTRITDPDESSNLQLGQKANTSNIIGILPGNDPELAKEVIIISGHRDHLGFNNDLRKQYPGANDDLTGVAATLELARAFAKLEGQNKRTLMFVAYGAEEQKYMGSIYHSQNPVAAAPNAQIVLMISIDMIGLGYDKWQSFSQKQMDAYSKRWFREVYNDSDEDKDAYSHEYPKTPGPTFDYDAGPFARIGINTRVIGLADVPNYHSVNDTPDNVHFKPMVNVTRTLFDYLWQVDQDDQPRTR